MTVPLHPTAENTINTLNRWGGYWVVPGAYDALTVLFPLHQVMSPSGAVKSRLQMIIMSDRCGRALGNRGEGGALSSEVGTED